MDRTAISLRSSSISDHIFLKFVIYYYRVIVTDPLNVSHNTQNTCQRDRKAMTAKANDNSARRAPMVRDFRLRRECRFNVNSRSRQQEEFGPGFTPSHAIKRYRCKEDIFSE